MKILSVLLVSCVLSVAGLINAVSIVVNNEPITLFEIEEIKNKLKLSSQEAVGILIDKKIEDKLIKDLNIKVDDFELNERVILIAKKNSLTVDELKKVVIDKFADWTTYLENMRNSILKEKLAQNLFKDELVIPTKEDARNYYESNKRLFSKPDRVEVIKYISHSKEALASNIMNPLMLSKNVKKEKETIVTAKLNPNILSLIMETEDGHFTQIFPLQDLFMSLYISEKKDLKLKSFEELNQEILEKLTEKNRENAIKNYFAKERSRAKIDYIRIPN